MIRSAVRLVACVACGLAGIAFAQAPAPGSTGIAAPAAPILSAVPACCALAAGTLVDLEIVEPINSWQHKRGDKFALRLAQDVVVDVNIVIAAGTPGVGEVVHAAAARGGGAPGELLLAARYLNVSGQRIPLRGMKLGASGEDNSGMAIGVSLAAGPFALFIRGREIEIPAGTRVHAKVAGEHVLPRPPLPSNQPLGSDP